VFEILPTCRSEAELVAAAGRAVQRMGFDLWSYSVRLERAGGVAPAHWSLGNCTAEVRRAWSECFEHQLASPAGPRLRCGIPYAWQAAPEAMRALAQAHGLHGGLCVPVPARGDAMGHLAIAARRAFSREALEAARPQALLFSKYLHLACLPHLEARRAERAPRLSAREAESLSWVARGKTTWEIARVLGLSEHTVVYHLRNACAKLDAHNRQRAVTRSIELGLLLPDGSVAAQPRANKRATRRAAPPARAVRADECPR
jgi:DNA-binding CsgD family transcriptional regulator